MHVLNFFQLYSVQCNGASRW